MNIGGVLFNMFISFINIHFSFNKEWRHCILLLLGLLVRQSTLHSLTQPASQPASPRPPQPAQGADMTSSRERSLCFNLIVFIMIRLTHIALLMIIIIYVSASQSFSFFATIWTISVLIVPKIHLRTRRHWSAMLIVVSWSQHHQGSLPGRPVNHQIQLFFIKIVISKRSSEPPVPSLSKSSIITFFWLALQWSYKNRYNISQKYRLTNEATYPLLYNCFLPQSLPCSTKNSASKCLEILLSAKNHGVEELTVPKKSKNKTNRSKMYLNGNI